MARVYNMTWVASSRRWLKEYKGRKYAVSCRQLGVPETKEGSYQAANAWWQAKKAELDGYTAPRPGTAQAMKLLLEAWAGGPLNTPDEAAAALLDLMAHHQDKHLPGVVREAILGPAAVQQIQEGAVLLLDKPRAPAETSVAAYAAAWQRHQQTLVAAGQLSPDRCDNNRVCLSHFLTFAGAEDVAGVDAPKLEQFYLLCVGRMAERRADPDKGWSVAYAKDVFGVARSFIRWLAERDFCPLPKNIASRSFKFGGGARAVRTWTVNDFKRAVEGSPEKLRLCLLLQANCGMTQMDVSELRDAEVDWTHGTVTRKRTKTAACESTPLVCYKLWPTTFSLLKKLRSGGERVLLTHRGQQYVRKALKDGRLCKTDSWRAFWSRVRRRLGINRPLKQLRKLGASILEGHPAYGRFVPHWLGHSPRTVSARHYTIPSQELFDEAVAWLGQQLGQ
jgi:integrase